MKLVQVAAQHLQFLPLALLRPLAQSAFTWLIFLLMAPMTAKIIAIKLKMNFLLLVFFFFFSPGVNDCRSWFSNRIHFFLSIFVILTLFFRFHLNFFAFLFTDVSQSIPKPMHVFDGDQDDDDDDDDKPMPYACFFFINALLPRIFQANKCYGFIHCMQISWLKANK